jgi:hypothetical protein
MDANLSRWNIGCGAMTKNIAALVIEAPENPAPGEICRVHAVGVPCTAILESWKCKYPVRYSSLYRRVWRFRPSVSGHLDRSRN